jgi:hypothetical protein
MMTAVHKRANAKRAAIDRELPYQVALPEILCCMENLTPITDFCSRFARRAETTRVTAIWPNNTRLELRLHCFANRGDTEEFADHFEGEHFNPKRDRGKGTDRGVWRRTGAWEFKEQTGPLKMPRFFVENP